MLVELTAEQFDLFSEKHPLTSFQQTSDWATLKSTNGWGHHFFGWKEKEELVGATMVLDKTFIRMFHLFYAPRGLLVDYHNEKVLKDFSEALVSKIKSLGGITLKIDPYIDTRELDSIGELVEGGYDNRGIISELEKIGYRYRIDENGNPVTTIMHSIYVLPFKGRSKEDLFKSFSPTTRTTIRQAEKNGITVSELKKEELTRFKTLMNKTSERRDFVDRPLSYYEAIYDAFHDSGRVKFMIATLNAQNLVETMKGKVDQEQATYDRLVQRKQANPDIFKDEGKLSDTILKLDSAKMRLKQAADLKEEYGEVIDLTVNMDFVWGNEIVSLYGGNEKALLKFGSQYYMQWQMIQEALDKGYQRYNFYGIPNDLKNEDSMRGVFETKKGFNGQVIHLLGEFDYVISPVKFKLYQICSNLYFRLKQR